MYYFKDEGSNPMIIQKNYAQMGEIFSIERSGSDGMASICAENGLFWLQVKGDKLMLQGIDFRGHACL